MIILSSSLFSVQDHFLWGLMFVIQPNIYFIPCLGLQSWVYSMNSSGLSTEPWGAPVVSSTVDEVSVSLSVVCLSLILISSCRMRYWSPWMRDELARQVQVDCVWFIFIRWGWCNLVKFLHVQYHKTTVQQQACESQYTAAMKIQQNTHTQHNTLIDKIMHFVLVSVQVVVSLFRSSI